MQVNKISVSKPNNTSQSRCRPVPQAVSWPGTRALSGAGSLSHRDRGGESLAEADGGAFTRHINTGDYRAAAAAGGRPNANRADCGWPPGDSCSVAQDTILMSVPFDLWYLTSDSLSLSDTCVS